MKPVFFYHLPLYATLLLHTQLNVTLPVCTFPDIDRQAKYIDRQAKYIDRYAKCIDRQAKCIDRQAKTGKIRQRTK